MITHNDLYSGSFGKLYNAGGARMCTTPHTVSVPPKYTIDIKQNSQAELIANSLDGMLWLYRNGDTINAVALRWNASAGKLKLAAVELFSDNDDVLLARGLDWVLTNKRIFMVSENSAILSADLFDADIPDTFLYSILRSKGMGAAETDPFTQQTWGRREDNGNSEGTGRFSKDTYLLYPAGTHSFEQCYSLLPAVGDWQIFENFLIHRPDAGSINSYHNMQAIRPIIPLEFSRGSAAYGTGYNSDHRGIQLFHKDGEIWGKGFQTIGKVSIIPAVFNEDGTVHEYYLYIQPDFTFYPYSDFFYSNIKTFDVNTDKELLNDDDELPEDYEPVLHSFAVSTIARTWAEANANCRAIGGHLATSTSAEKNTFLSSLTSASVWLGGTDEAEEGVWQWVTGEEWNYINWANGQPDNTREAEHYLHTNFGGANGLWNDGSGGYLCYICEWDYVLDENDFLGCLWPNISIASIGDNSIYGFLSEQADALSSGACLTASNPKLLSLQNNEWINLFEHEGKMFIDTLNLQALILYENGAQFVRDIDSDIPDYQCNNLPQWLAPAGKVEAVTDYYVVASADRSSFCTSLLTGFNREVVFPCVLPLSGTTFADKENNYFRVAVQENIEEDKKTLGIHHLLSHIQGAQNIDWTSIYKWAIDIRLLGHFTTQHDFYLYPYIYLITRSGNKFTYENVCPIFYSSPLKIYTRQIEYTEQTVYDIWGNPFKVPDTDYIGDAETMYEYVVQGYNLVSLDGTNGYVHAVVCRVEASLFAIHPETGEAQYFDFSCDIPYNLVLKEHGRSAIVYASGGTYPIYYTTHDAGEQSTVYWPQRIAVYDSKLGVIAYSAWDKNYTEAIFLPAMDIPAYVKDYINDRNFTDNLKTGISLNDIYNYDRGFWKYNVKRSGNSGFFDNLPQDIYCPASAVFSEINTNSLFLLNIPSMFAIQKGGTTSGIISKTLIRTGEEEFIFNWWHRTLFTGLHVMAFSVDSSRSEGLFIVFRSEPKPNILDFQQELERSIPS